MSDVNLAAKPSSVSAGSPMGLLLTLTYSQDALDQNNAFSMVNKTASAPAGSPIGLLLSLTHAQDQLDTTAIWTLQTKN
jgi:hypothetical protein